MNKRKIKYRVVYLIKNILSGKVYVGSAENYYSRTMQHRKELRGDCHSNNLLQRAWNKYGEAAFIFGVIEELGKGDNIVQKEQFWMDFYEVGDKSKCYNLKLFAYSNLGYKYSNATKQKMSLAKKGKKWTLLQREVLSTNKPPLQPVGEDNKRSKPVVQISKTGDKVLWASVSLCARITGLHRSNIFQCLNGRIKQCKGFSFQWYNEHLKSKP